MIPPPDPPPPPRPSPARGTAREGTPIPPAPDDPETVTVDFYNVFRGGPGPVASRYAGVVGVVGVVGTVRVDASSHHFGVWAGPERGWVPSFADLAALEAAGFEVRPAHIRPDLDLEVPTNPCVGAVFGANRRVLYLWRRGPSGSWTPTETIHGTPEGLAQVVDARGLVAPQARAAAEAAAAGEAAAEVAAAAERWQARARRAEDRAEDAEIRLGLARRALFAGDLEQARRFLSEDPSTGDTGPASHAFGIDSSGLA